jgi:hypothetical protein
MSDIAKRVQRLEAMRAAETPSADPAQPMTVTAENVNDLSEETVERMLHWYSLRLQVFKPGQDAVRRRFIQLWYAGLRNGSNPDPELVKGWRKLHEEEEAAWAAYLPQTSLH